MKEKTALIKLQKRGPPSTVAYVDIIETMKPASYAAVEYSSSKFHKLSSSEVHMIAEKIPIPKLMLQSL